MDRETAICSLLRIIIFTTMFTIFLFLAEIMISINYLMGMFVYIMLPTILIWEFESIILFCFRERDGLFEKMSEERK